MASYNSQSIMINRMCFRIENFKTDWPDSLQRKNLSTNPGFQGYKFNESQDFIKHNCISKVVILFKRTENVCL